MTDAGGPIALVTGATSGIGRALAESLASSGATVGIVARDGIRGEDVRTAIAAATDNPRIEVFAADLSSLSSIRALTEEIDRAYPTLDILINSAAVFTRRRTGTADGLELMFATNHLAPFLLTILLLDRLTAGVGGRVLTLTAPSTVRPDLDDLQSERRFRALNAFGASKAANLLFTYALARRLEGSGVTANAVHPGLVRSKLMRLAPAPLRWATWIVSHSPEEAADSIVPLATSIAYVDTSGRFFRDGREIRSASFTHDLVFQDRLWNVSAGLAGLSTPA